MIDPQLLRDNPDAVRASQKLRGAPVADVDVAIAADLTRRAAINAFETVRAEQNAFGKTVAAAPKDEKAALNEAETAFAEVARGIQNIVIEGVPAGGEDDYVVLREVGEKPTFAFEPRDHLAIGELLDAIDMERGAKVSGARFHFLKGVGARLEIALMNLALDRALEAGFTPLITPTLVRPEIMAGTGFLGAHADEIYYLPGDDLYLTGTSEVALAGYHKDEILDVAAGPLRYAG
ncbi:MAG: serine--tRNA ligase, partial [Pseudolysinimonas sp.]